MSKPLAAVIWLCAFFLGSTAQAQTSPPPAPWNWTDIGAVGTPGDVHVGANNDWFVSGAGSDIWGPADSFLFAYQPIRDGRVGATVESETNTSPFAKAGVMLRQSLDPGSPAVILDVKPDGGIEFMKRLSPGGETTFIAGASVPVTSDGSGGVTIGVFLELERSGHTVSASYCLGNSCTQVGTTDFIDGSALAGVAVTSHDPSTLNHASFRTPPFVDGVPTASVDVGDVGTAGYATYDESVGRFFVSGAGSDIWGTADSFRYTEWSLSGDSQLAARVFINASSTTNAFAKAGLTIGDATLDAARVILDVRPDGGIEFMARSTAGAPMTFVAGSSASTTVWLRLTRAANLFTGEMSPDGQTWTTVGSVTVVMPVTTRGGFAVTSHDRNLLLAAEFDDFGLTTGLDLGPLGRNLLVNPGFEDSIAPNTAPGWVSDTPLRQTPAVTELTLSHSGAQNAACRTTSGDCGIYQEVTARDLLTADMWLVVYARADHPGALVGVNIDGEFLFARPVQVGRYQPVVLGFNAFSGSGSNPNPVIRVWIYAPATSGVVAIDDVELRESMVRP
jgi:hypothetical protein